MNIGTDEETPAGGTPPRRRITTRIIRWRDWSLAVKLAAVVLVPVTFALALGILQIGAQISKAHEYARLDAVVSTAGTVRSTAAALEDERTGAAGFLSRGPSTAEELRGRFAETDRALRDSVSALDSRTPLNSTVTSAREQVRTGLAAIRDLRGRVLTRATDPAGAIEEYGGIVDSLLALDRALIGEVSTTELGSIAGRLHELGRVGQEMRLQQAWVLVGALRPELADRSNAELHASEIRRHAATEEFRAAAPPEQRREYDRLSLDPAFSARENSLRMAMALGGDSTLGGDRTSDSSALPFLPTHVWEGQSRAALSSLNSLQDDMQRQQHRTAFALHDSASDLAGLESVLLLSALLTAGVIVTVFARQLHGSLETLRHSALDTANSRLPRALAEVRTGRPQSAIGQVPVHTTEEVGQVARAFDDVQTQAISLAAEQAELRKNYSDSFVNVSRRSQSLLERQLRLFEQLERDEEDPDQLATLFQLDHLATRMRRNNENLMVLSGTDLTRRFTRPVPPADLVRAAISEIEHYPRVVVQPLPEVKIVGYAASDLVRLLAELLDNAANFSAPHTTVAVSGQRPDDGSLELSIVDQGIGMTGAELAAVNERLTADREPELSTSRRMGLFVVARLADRHGIDVRLLPGSAGTGVRVTISLRQDLLLPTPPTSGINGAARPRAELDPNGVEDTLVQPLQPHPAHQAGTAPPVPTRNGFHAFGDASSARHPRPRHWRDQPHPRRDDTVAPDRWHHNGAGNAHHEATVPTPIFDSLASAWFQSAGVPPRPARLPDPDVRWPERTAADEDTAESPPEPSEASTTRRSEEGLDWRFTSDEDRLRAEEVSTAEPASYTSVGLPVRVPRANLVAGSADANGSTSSGPHRDPELTRRRMSSFQDGIRRGRHRHDETGARRREPEPRTTDDESSTDWALPTDTAEQEVRAALSQEPETYTSAGLPQRTPRARLAPGAAGPAPEDERPQRDADLVRGRLSDFQRGVREGRHSLRNPAEDR